MALCTHSTAGPEKAKEIKNIELLDTEYEGLHHGIQNFPTQSFDGFTCGYEYVSNDFEEIKFLNGDPFGVWGKAIKKNVKAFHETRNKLEGSRSPDYYWRKEVSEEEMTNVRIVQNISPRKRSLDNDKLAKFLETKYDVWAEDLAPDYLVIDNFADFFSSNDETLSLADLAETRNEVAELTKSSRLLSKS